MRPLLRVLIVLMFIVIASAPFARAEEDRYGVDPSHLSLEDGYHAEAVAVQLSIPTTAVFDGEDILVAESGFGNVAKPRVLRITPDGKVSVVAEEGLAAPVTGILVAGGRTFISHHGKVSVVENGALQDIVTDLPSGGDHQNNQIVLGPDGRIYMGQGTVTNSGVLGEDNAMFGWLKDRPETHDVPCEDIVLTGENFESANPVSGSGKAMTGAYKPFGATSTADEVIKGNPKCNGAILSFNQDGGDLRVEAWGLRNPFGLEFDASGQLWATYHGADVRGSRPIANDPDYLVKVERGAWYGWPDFYGGKPVTDARFRPLGTPAPRFLLKNHPPLTQAFTYLPSHSATNGIGISTSDAFGYKGDAFIALFGSFTPVTTNVQDLKFTGFKIIRVSLTDGSQHDFVGNKIPGPALLNRQEGFNRPSDVVFGPDGSMYVVDWGSSTLRTEGLESSPETGVIWRIYKDGAQTAKWANGPVVVSSAVTPEEDRHPLVANNASTYRELWPVLTLVGLLVLAGIGFAVKH